ncbi:L-lactate dehydrogenase [Cyanobium sp.]|jgi:L-lactate dehydrogenase|nr:L-lactate dehydrogenase [Cyanobium sp.]
MKRSVGIIGTGRVGSSVALCTLHSGVVDELLLNDLKTELVEGEAMDLAHGASYYPTAAVRSATDVEMLATDAIVISAGRGSKPGESRLQLLHENVARIKAIGAKLTGYGGTIVMVTNPVDILTSVMAEISGLPLARVVGTGTMLDTARLRQVLGRVLRLDPHSVDAQVLGEHGDSEVVLWSGVRIGGVPLRSWPGWDRSQEPLLAKEVSLAADQIIRRKGATNHAIGLVTAELLRCLLRGERRVLTVSRVQAGALGLWGVALSLPTVVSSEGAIEVLEPAMDQDEHDLLERSAEVLRRGYREALQLDGGAQAAG